MLHFLMKLCQFNFGVFGENEFKKFLRMGFIFSLIVGIYWTLRTLKDSIFIHLVDKMYLPYAKTISVLALIPLVIVYTKLLDRVSRERMLIILPLSYGITTLIFSILILFAQSTSIEVVNGSTVLMYYMKLLGYLWYFFVDSFGSLFVALFWTFATDTTTPESAKRGFPLIVAIGQLGGIFMPYFISGLPYRLGLTTDALSTFISGLLILFIIIAVKSFLANTPKDQLTSFTVIVEKENKNKQAGFLEGLRIIFSHKYLIGIFVLHFVYDIVTAIFDFNFKLAAATAYEGVALSNYLGLHGSFVNIASLLCLLLGVSNIPRFLGITFSLVIVPIIALFGFLSFLTINNLTFLFALVIASKAVNYSLSNPIIKQLYIPTSRDVRFKSQAWIEIFGSRASQEAGAVFNMMLKPLQSVYGEIIGKTYYLTLSGFICFPLIGLWLIASIYLGRIFNKSIKTKQTIC